MKRKYFIVLAILALAGLVLVTGSCVKEDFDTPPLYSKVATWEKSISIAQLKNLYNTKPALIKDVAPTEFWDTIIVQPKDTIIGIFVDAYVLSSDSAGNFYETVTIADETGGIDLKINTSNLYTTYGLKPGKRVLVRVDNLAIDNYNGMYQIGLGYTDGGVLKVTGIEPSAISKTIQVPGDKISIQPETITIPTLSTDKVQKLVKLEGVQFWNPAATYSMPGVNTNRILVDQDGNQIILRTSGYAKFAKNQVPTGSGSITGVLSLFGSTYQLLIRDTLDIKFDQPRFGSEVPAKNTTIEQLKLLYDGSALYPIPYDLVIEGVITANDESGNLYKQLFIEDETGAIEFKVDVTGLYTDFPVGTKIRINCKYLYLGTYGGVIQLGGNNNGSIGRLPASDFYKNVFVISTGNEVSVTETSIAQLSDSLIGKVVTLSGVQFADNEMGKTYAESSVPTNRILEEVTTGRTIIVRTSNYANFAGVELPTGRGKITAVLTKYNSDYQLTIRKVGEVRLIEPRLVKTFILSQDFQSAPVTNPSSPISIDGWKTIAEAGTKVWNAKQYSGNVYAEMNPYQSGEANNTAWLISPNFNIPSGVNAYLKFDTQYNYWANATLEVFISSNFDGSNPQSATWTKLTDAYIVKQADGTNRWVSSGNINIKDFAGNACIGFKYTGSSTISTAFRVDNVTVFTMQ
ncbi:MAG TPA: hypothetical protein ENN49_06660 [Bacteroidales bacterium]|nr:hypothetical protein [Bacteroidales bacterium]